MSMKMGRDEFRGMAFAQSYIGNLPNPPSYFANLFELIAYPDGDQTKVDLQYVDVCMDVVEKLGFVRQSEDALVQLVGAMKQLGLIVPASPAQLELSRLLRESKYYVYMLIWSTRSLLDALAVHLNGLWSLGHSSAKIWLGSSNFRDSLWHKRRALANALNKQQSWFSTVDRYRLVTIHKEPILVLPNADPTIADWDLCLPADPRGCLRRFISGELGELCPVLGFAAEWWKEASRTTELVMNDTISALHNGDATTKGRARQTALK